MACTLGRGVDRHLLALRCIASAQGGDLPSIFTEEGYNLFSTSVLSTSTMGEFARSLDGGGFAPVTPEGYGIGYGIVADGTGLFATSYRGDTSDLLKHVVSAIEDMRRIILGSTE